LGLTRKRNKVSKRGFYKVAAQYFSAFLRPVLVLGCLLHLTLAAAAATGAASIPRPEHPRPVAIDGRRIGHGRPGAVTGALLARYRDHLANAAERP